MTTRSNNMLLPNLEYNLPDFVFQAKCIVLNATLDPIYFDNEFEKLIKYDLKDYYLNPNLKIIPSTTAIQKILSQKGGFNNLELELKDVNEEPLYFLFNGFSQKIDEKIIYILFYNHISNLKRDQRNFYTRDLELNTLIYKISHDLRGPLATARGLINLTQLEKEKNNKDKYYQMLFESVNKLDEKVNSLAQLASLSTHSQYLFSSFEIHDIVYNSLNNISKKYDLLDIIFDFNINVNTPISTYQFAVESIFTQLFIHCIDNKKQSQKLQLKLDICKIDNFIEISLVNNGLGLSKKHLENIFMPFYRISDLPSHATLSLFTLKKNVDFLGGNIQILSKEGKGSKFHIKFAVL
jgi:signal transduction histidine kinase